MDLLVDFHIHLNRSNYPIAEWRQVDHKSPRQKQRCSGRFRRVCCNRDADDLGLQVVEEAFRKGAVVAIGLAAHLMQSRQPRGSGDRRVRPYSTPRSKMVAEPGLRPPPLGMVKSAPWTRVLP